MKLIRFLKGHLIAVLACLLLLVVQAHAELALPTLMSDIVDVGIQQDGIPTAVPSTIREQSLSDLEMFMTVDDAKAVDDAFGPADDNGVRSYLGTSDADGGTLSDLMSLPETIALSLAEGIDPSTLTGEGASVAMTAPSTPEAAQSMAQMQQILAANGGKMDMDFVRAAFDAGVITRDQLTAAADSMADSMGAMSGSIISQRAVSYVSSEYEAQGIDINQVRSDYLAAQALAMFEYCLVGLTATVLVGFIASRTGSKIARDLRKRTFTQVMAFSPAEVGKFSQASLITRCTNDIQQIQMVVTMMLRMVLYAPVMGTLAVIQVMTTHTGLDWLIGVGLVVVLATMGILLGITMPRFRSMQQLVDRVNLAARETLDGLMPIRAFGRQDFELKRFDEASSDLMRTQVFTNRAMALAMPIMMLLMNMLTVSIMWFGSQGVDAGLVQVGDIMAFISYAMQIIMSFMMLSMIMVMLPRAEVAAGRVDDVLVCPLSITDPANPRTPAPDAGRGQLVFDDVSFGYPDAEANVVEHVSFTATPGRTTAIIGSTGSGKSSLVQLIPRLYDVVSGSITLDGVDVRDMALSDLRGRIGYVPQQGLLFSGTIASNVSFASDDITDEQMEKAAEVAQATEFISESADGFATEIAQRGANVSGGQRQRLSIARALAANPEVLVLDDSFSALDYTTDARLREALATQATDTAVVVVAQRVASIMHADDILVLDDGKVVGQGTHKDLLHTCPTYLEIAQSQLSARELGLEGGEL